MATDTPTPRTPPSATRILTRYLLPSVLIVVFLGVLIMTPFLVVRAVDTGPQAPGQERVLTLRRVAEPLHLRYWDYVWLWLVLGLVVTGLLASLGYVAYLVSKYFRTGRVAGRPWTAVLAVVGCLVFMACAAVFLRWALLGSGVEGSGYAWLLLLVPATIAGFVYSAWMYVRDAQTVGWLWGLFLCGLRCCVYLLLALIFLLPSAQSWEKSEQRYEVLVLFDVSDSMGVKDDLPDEKTSYEKLPSRQDKVIDFLSHKYSIGTDEGTFLEHLQRKNPTFVYRFGSQLDAEFKAYQQGDPPPTRDDWAAWLKIDPKKLADAVKDRGERDARERFLRQLTGNTNVGDSVLSLYKRKSTSLLQGIVVVSDGRSNEGSAQALADLRRQAAAAQVPIFTLAVGEDRPRVNLRITRVEAPSQARPDDKFAINVDLDGEGLPGAEKPVTLEITPPGGKPIPLEPKQATFQPGEPPHAEVEFVIDPEKLPAELVRAGKESGKKELEEGTWTFQARVPRDRRESYPHKDHVSKKVKVEVVKKSLRVLLVAGGPTREFQFVKNLFVREAEHKRAELSIYLQTARPETVLDVPNDRKLMHFPSRMEEEGLAVKEGEKYYNLALYDLIIAFDPDWTNLTSAAEMKAIPDAERDERQKELTLQRLNLLKRWVDKQAGGLVFVAGPVNTYQLARGPNRDLLEPILTLCPIVPEDNRLQTLPGKRRSTADPWRLRFVGANPELNFLKLDDQGTEPLAGWKDFFGTTEKPIRGFYNYYPARNYKKGANIVATFGDPRAQMTDNDIPDEKRGEPYIVTMPYGRGKVVYLAWGELWRLREFHEGYYERFWAKLGRYAGSGNLTGATRRGLLIMSENFLARKPAHVTARVLGPDLMPVPKNSRPPKVEVFPPADVKLERTVYELQPRESQANEPWDGRFVADLQLPGSDNPYRIELHIPDTVDTREFYVEKDNPELNDVRPDFGQLYQLASPSSAVAGRLDERTRARLGDVLKLATSLPVGGGDETEAPHLFFTLDTADFIPQCMIAAPPHVERHKGELEPLWDKGPATGGDVPTAVVSALLKYLPFALLGALAVSMGAYGGFLLATGREPRPVALGWLGGALAALVFGVIGLVGMNPVLGVLTVGLAITAVVSLVMGKNATAAGIGMVVFGMLWLGRVFIVPGLEGAVDKPAIFSTIMLVVVALLSVEWLTRKLLKLA
jgi:hypothetical protein